MHYHRWDKNLNDSIKKLKKIASIEIQSFIFMGTLNLKHETSAKVDKKW